MCGINGIINSKSKDLVDRINTMNSSVQNRGPDGTGIVVSDNSALGHTRLAIVDAENRNADQPMEYNGLTITFNGEIYNHKELRKELEKKGHSFDTNCDTEVLLKGYSEFGEKILDKIKGQFAFAVYDKETKETFLARDITAIKPLYFSNGGGKLIFSSSPKAILEAGINFNPDLDAICAQFLAGSTFAAGEEPLNNSIYADIQQLNPGECMVVDKDGNIAERKRYFSLPIKDVKVEQNPEKKEKEIEKYAGMLREKLTNSIRDRIAPEVNMGVMLSGGLDSSIVTAVLAEELNKNYKDKELVVSTIRYLVPGVDIENEKLEKDVNTDYHYAKKLVNNLQEKGFNIKFKSYDITPDNFLDNLEDMVGALGIHDSIRQLAMFGNYKELAKSGVKVALSGEGADEFNWGYWKAFPGLASDQKTGDCATKEKFKEMMKKRGDFVKSLFNTDIDIEKAGEYLTEIYSSFDTTDSARKMMGLYGVEFLGFLNKANDRCAMANSIENRVPYQDKDVVELCLQIPREYQTDVESGLEKDVLKKAFEGELEGTGILERAKIPLPAAAHVDYHEKVLEKYNERVESVDGSFWNYFNRDTFEKMGKSFESRISDLMQEHNGDALKAGFDLVKWRDISIDDFDVIGKEEKGNYIAGKDIRTNDVFKLLTTMVWYDQEVKK